MNVYRKSDDVPALKLELATAETKLVTLTEENKKLKDKLAIIEQNKYKKKPDTQASLYFARAKATYTNFSLVFVFFIIIGFVLYYVFNTGPEIFALFPIATFFGFLNQYLISNYYDKKASDINTYLY